MIYIVIQTITIKRELWRILSEKNQTKVKQLWIKPNGSLKNTITSKETFDLTENADDDIEDDDRIDDSKQNTEMITFTRSNRDERKFVEQQRFPTPPPPPPEAMTVIPKSLSQTFQQQTILSEYCEPN
uniref:Uncharacterized protein n=1 Tax=Sarcoptes scabiei TaxID=52283 RepID=A0A834R2T8_SARSC